jgi:protein phosphatase
MKLVTASATAIGPRAENQDRALCMPRAGLIAVADGMGGEAEGARCAEVAIAAVKQARRTVGDPIALVRGAHEAVRAAMHGRGYGGTTLVVAQLQPGWVHVAWLGDSVAVLVGATGARLLTWPQNVPGSLLRKQHIDEEEYRCHPARNMLLAHCGMRGTPPVEGVVLPIGRGDWIVLCTDGAFDPVGTNGVARAVCAVEPAQTILRAAAVHGLTDNATVAVARWA